MDKTKKILRIVGAVLLAVISAMFIADIVRIKWFKEPPMFCVEAYTYNDGVSTQYYGAGYKVKKDYDLTDGSVEYYITLWILPDSISL